MPKHISSEWGGQLALLTRAGLTRQRCRKRNGRMLSQPTSCCCRPRACRVEIVSAAFDGKNAVQRHRMVYQLLQEEIDAGLHALALKTKTPAEVGRQ